MLPRVLVSPGWGDLGRRRPAPGSWGWGHRVGQPAGAAFGQCFFRAGAGRSEGTEEGEVASR